MAPGLLLRYEYAIASCASKKFVFCSHCGDMVAKRADIRGSISLLIQRQSQSCKTHVLISESMTAFMSSSLDLNRSAPPVHATDEDQECSDG